MQTFKLSVPLQEYRVEKELERKIQLNSGISEADFKGYRVIRRSIDARHGRIVFNLSVEAIDKGERFSDHPEYVSREFQNVADKEPILIVGSGPAGLFAALKAIEIGLRPIVIERGKNVRERRRDLAAISRNHIVDPNSNYCFGEGGAGTYSDGKLYTRSAKRKTAIQILSTFVQFGASEDILVDAHPHIGTDRLPGIIASIRDLIIECGGEVRFNTRMTDLRIADNRITGIEVNESEVIKTSKVVLAVGHSARDVYELLFRKGILIEQKQFAMGVRVEHPQDLIDKIQYHGQKCDILPAATYSWVEQVRGRGVYSFCMCPGGIIAPCATAPGEIVTNGWSPSKRNNRFANSGIVVPIENKDLKLFQTYGPLAGMRFQQAVEQAVCVAGGGTQTAPAQRLADFVSDRQSSDLPPNSYHPGTVSQQLSDILPESIASRLKAGFISTGKKMKGYMTNQAVVVAVESRTSSPVRIPRERTGEHPQIKGLYPVGEGAGYAGGIVSAAIDGDRAVGLMVD